MGIYKNTRGIMARKILLPLGVAALSFAAVNCSKTKAQKIQVALPEDETALTAPALETGVQSSTSTSVETETPQSPPVPAPTPTAFVADSHLNQRLPASLPTPNGQNAVGFRWEGLSVSGSETCATENIYTVFAGTQALFGFRNLGLALPPLSGLKKSFSCDVTANVTLPLGTYVKSIEQSFVTRLVKELGGTGFLSSKGYFFGSKLPMSDLAIVFNYAESIPASETDFVRTNTQHIGDEGMYVQCASSMLNSTTTSFKFQIKAELIRPLIYTNFTMSYGDNDFVYKLNSTLGTCPFSSIDDIIGQLPH